MSLTEFVLAGSMQILIGMILLCGMGSWLARWVLSSTDWPDLALMAPFFGFAVISSICIYLGTLGVPVEHFAWMLLIGAMAGLVVMRRRLWSSLRHHWRVMALVGIAYLLAMLPLLRLGYLTTVGGTIDAISYAVRSEYLQTAGLIKPTATAGQPFYDWVAAHIDFLRVGDVYFVSIINALSGARSYQTLTTVAGFFFALTPAAMFVFARRTLRLKQPAALLAAVLIGVHNLLLWVVYDNFLSQAIAVSLFPMVLALGVRSIRTRGRRETIGFAALLAGLISVYPIYALPIAAFGFGYGMILVVRQMRQRQARVWVMIKRYSVWAAALVGLTFVWNAPALWRAYKELSFIGTLMGPDATSIVGPGNLTMFVPISVMSGLAAHADVVYQLGIWRLPDWLLWAGVLAWLSGIGFGWSRLRVEARWIAAIALGIIVGLALQQRFLINSPAGYAYGYFKIASLIVLVTLPLFAQAVYTLLKVPRWCYLAWAAIAAVVGLNVVNSFITIGYVVKDNIVIDQSVIETAQGLQSVPADAWVQIDVRSGLKQNWIAYLLRNQHIHFREPPLLWNWVIPDVDPTTVDQYALVENGPDVASMQRSLLDEPWYNPQGYDTVWHNTHYELRQRRETALADVLVEADRADWSPGAKLNITANQRANRLELRFDDDELMAGMLITTPQTIQLVIVVTEPDAELQVADTRARLSQGVWKVNVALNEGAQISIQNSGTSPVLLYRVSASSAVLDVPLVAELQPDGAAIVFQTLEGTAFEYRAALLRPQGDETSTYQMNVSIINSTTKQALGTWGLDFSPTGSMQRGDLKIDLKSRTAQGWVNGDAVAIYIGPREVRHGDFESQVAWLRIDDQPVNLALCHCARFGRFPGGQVEPRSIPSQAPLVLVPPPWSR